MGGPIGKCGPVFLLVGGGSWEKGLGLWALGGGSGAVVVVGSLIVPLGVRTALGDDGGAAEGAPGVGWGKLEIA